MVQLVRLPKLVGPCRPGKRNRSEGPELSEEDEDVQPSQKEARQELGQEEALSNEKQSTCESTTGDHLQVDRAGAESCSQSSTPRVKTMIHFFNLKSTPKLADTPKSTKRTNPTTPSIKVKTPIESSPSARNNSDQSLKIQGNEGNTQETKDKGHKSLLEHPGRPPENHKDKEN